MFGPRRHRRRNRPRDNGHGGDYWDPDLEALVPGGESGYFGHGDMGDMRGPEFYPDPWTGRVNAGQNHDFTPGSRGSHGRRGNHPGGGIIENINDGRGGRGGSNAWAIANGSSFEVWNNGRLVASSGGPTRVRQTRRPDGGIDIHFGGRADGFGGFNGFGGPEEGFGGRRHRRHRCSRHGRRPRGGPGRMTDFGFGRFDPDFGDMFDAMFDDSDFSDYSDDDDDDFGGPGGSAAWGEDPFSGSRGHGRGERGDTGGSRHGGGGPADYDDDGDGVGEETAGDGVSRRGCRGG